jgi:oligopeptidase B
MNNNNLPPICDIKEKQLSIHNDERLDNYYWLNDREDPNVIAYLNKENDYTNSHMKDTEDQQKTIFQELKGRIKEDDQSVPYEFNGYSYWRKFNKGDEHAIYLRKKIESEIEEILIDGNVLAKEFDFFDLGDYDISPNNNLMAYGFDSLSRRIYQIKFKNLVSGEMYSDLLENTTGSMVWANDNQTIFYTKQDEKTLRSFQIYAHKLGTKQSEDSLIYEEKDDTFYCYVYKSKSEKFIVINSSSTLSDEYRLIPSDKPLSTPKIFQPRLKGLEYSIYHKDDLFYIISNEDHHNFSLKTCSVNNTGKENWNNYIDGQNDVLIEGLDVFENFIVITERKDGLLHLKVIDLMTNNIFYIPFNEPSYVVQTSTNLITNTNKLRFSYTSLVNPGTIYEYDMLLKTSKVLKEKEIVGGYNKEEYTSERIWADGRDGTKIPISIVYKKGIEKQGNNPTLLYAYGSYGYSIDPTFSSNRLSLLNRGFIFAIAHIRGGEDLGRTWYENGKLLKKKNTFYDFIDCGKYLINQKYSSTNKLYAAGGSAGGLLMGACINMEPKLFRGVIAHVPFVDVITTMLDESIPLTTGEYDEWGNPNQKEYYDYMLSYSPYDNIEKKEYPHMLVTTGLHDSQVQYWEPAKWVAKLRANKTDNNLLFLKTNMKTGHGGASGRFEYLKEIAFDYAFLLKLEEINN